MNTFNFIEQYTVPLSICDKFIKYHKKNKEYKNSGLVGEGVVNKDVKDSTDVLFYNANQQDFILEFFKYLSKYVTQYCEKYKIKFAVLTENGHRIQHYKKRGGYFAEHYERSPSDLKRELVYMLYCNNVKKGGTYFNFQNKETQCIKGNLIIWPAFFTHPHYGIISKDQEKYIVTGWFELI
tara:strand:- start:218 stop:760 length:543 start_codon:yes stop_codon:yes gene_type:complete